MSNLRHDEPFVRAYAVTHPSGTVIPPQTAGWDLLVYAASGVVTVVTAVGRWVTPPTRAVWIPSGAALRLEISGRARLRNLYFPTKDGSDLSGPAVVQVSPLLRELIIRTAAMAPLYRTVAVHEHLAALVLAELATVAVAPLDLPMPTDERALRFAKRLLDDPGTVRPIDVLAADAGASRRTLERLFRAETGMAVLAWRNRLRVLTALRDLGDGNTVAAISRSLGYSSSSAFVTMFRRETGTTPTAYFRDRPTVESRSS
jgi:AraC-like DNA-binding protein